MKSSVERDVPSLSADPALQQREELVVADLARAGRGARRPRRRSGRTRTARRRSAGRRSARRGPGGRRASLAAVVVEVEATGVVEPQPLAVRGERLVQPEVLPAAGGDGVTEPLVGQLVRLEHLGAAVDVARGSRSGRTSIGPEHLHGHAADARRRTPARSGRTGTVRRAVSKKAICSAVRSKYGCMRSTSSRSATFVSVVVAGRAAVEDLVVADQQLDQVRRHRCRLAPRPTSWRHRLAARSTKWPLATAVSPASTVISKRHVALSLGVSLLGSQRAGAVRLVEHLGPVLGREPAGAEAEPDLRRRAGRRGRSRRRRPGRRRDAVVAGVDEQLRVVCSNVAATPSTVTASTTSSLGVEGDHVERPAEQGRRSSPSRRCTCVATS